jgi:hypothetical protein
MARRSPPRKVTYFEPIAPPLARNTVIESTFEVGRRFRCTMRVDCGRLDPGAVIRPDPGEWYPRMPERGSRHPLPPNHLLGENREPTGRIGEDGLEQVTCFFAVPPLTQQNPEPLSSRRDLQRLASEI